MKRKKISLILAVLFSFVSIMAFVCDAAAADNTPCQHEVVCTDPGVCTICGKKVKENEITAFYHASFINKHNKKYHWQECGACGERTMPKLQHYTGCQEYAAGDRTRCSFCGAENIYISRKMQCVHESFDELRKDNNGELLHVKYCIACRDVVTDGRDPAPHKADLKYRDLGDGTHSRICSCGYAFDDAGHVFGGYKIERKATVSKSGKEVRTCKYCKAEQTKTIYKIGKIKLSKTKYKYNGKPHKPKVIIKDVKGNTIPDSYYKVIYPKNSHKTGKHTVKIVFKGKYSGMVKKTFKVKK